jgi:uncharacterized protein (DUF433 family)
MRIREPEAENRPSADALCRDQNGLIAILPAAQTDRKLSPSTVYNAPCKLRIRFVALFLVARLNPRERQMPANIIVKDSRILGGEPVFRDTRVPFQALLDYLEGGQKLDDFLNDFPTVSRETAIGALEEAKALVLARLE